MVSPDEMFGEGKPYGKEVEDKTKLAFKVMRYEYTRNFIILLNTILIYKGEHVYICHTIATIFENWFLSAKKKKIEVLFASVLLFFL